MKTNEFNTVLTVKKNAQNRGFALVATLSILALVVILSLALVSLSTNTTRAEANADANDTARANARIALMLAIAELQRTTGPDNVITAPADALALTDAQRTSNHLQRLTGAWWSWSGTSHERDTDATLPEYPDSRGFPATPNYNSKTVAYDPTDPDADPADPNSGRFLRWLVSGSNTSDPLSPPSLNPTSGSVALVGVNTIGDTDINKQVHVVPTAIGNGGSYAWWATGLSQRAKIADAPRPETEGGWSRRASSFGGFEKTALGLDEGEDITNLLSLKTFDFLDDGGTQRAQTNFYDLTSYSDGLLINVATSGWRKDMSMMVEQWDIWDEEYKKELAFFRLGLEEDYIAKAATSVNAASTQDGELIFPWGNSVADSNIVFPLGIPISQSWNYLQDWATIYRAEDVSTGISGRFPAVKSQGGQRDRVGLVPALARMSYLLSFDSVAAANNLFKHRLLITPVVTMWNPYSIPIRVEERIRLHMEDGTSPIRLSYKIEEPGENGGQSTDDDLSYLIDEAGLNSLRVNGNTRSFFSGGSAFFVITTNDDPDNPGSTSSVWQPGEVRTYTSDLSRNTRSIFLYPGVRYSDLCVLADVGKNNGYREGSFIKDLTLSGNNKLSNQIGVGMQMQLVRNGDNTNGSENYGVVQISTDPSRASLYFNPELDISASIDVQDTKIEEMERDPFPFVISNLGFRATEDQAALTESEGEKFQNPTVKGYLSQNPTSLYNRLAWDRFNTSVQLGNRFEDTSYDFSFIPIDSFFDVNLIDGNPTDATGYIGTSYRSTTGLSKMIVKDFLTRPMVSIGELQSFSINRLNSYPPNVADPIGNSHAFSVIPSDSVWLKDLEDRDVHGARKTWTKMVDYSYISNYHFFDDWTATSIAPLFETIGGSATLDIREVLVDFFANGGELPNSFYKASEQMTEDDAHSIFDDPDAWYSIASKIRVDGMFNINSTSVTAWKSLLGHSFGNEFPITDGDGDITLEAGDGALVSRTSIGLNTSGLTGEVDFLNPNRMTDEQIEALAEAIVAQIKLRGPFLSMAEFVNRQLRPSDSDTSTLSDEEKLARAGAIEAALLELNEKGNENDPNRELSENGSNQEVELATDVAATRGIDYLEPPFPEAGRGSTGYGYPGWIRQADILRPLAPVLSARDDSFKVRAYGSALDSNGNVIAEAWCEAIVSRYAEYVDPTDDSAPAPSSDGDIGLSSEINITYGRRYKIVSFKWLSKDEI